MRPPEANHHGQAFAIIFGTMLAITFVFGAWTWQAQTNELADEVRHLRVNP